MSVVGFDVGTQNCHIGIARGGGIEVIMNEVSDRCTPNFIFYHDSGRSIGITAKQKQMSSLSDCLFDYKPLIGRSLTDPYVSEEAAFYPYKLQTVDGRTAVTVKYCGNPVTLRLEQVYAAILTRLKATSEAAYNNKVTDCVISVPVFFTECQRQAVLDASAIAGLNCLRLMNDTTAVALTYGIFKQDLPAVDQPARNVVFINVGHYSTQVAVVAFNQGKLKVLSVAYNPKLGGRDFTMALYRHFAEDFRRRFKVDCDKIPKCRWRLMQECERLKKVMSSIGEKVPFSIECFYQETDVNGSIARGEFDELAAEYTRGIYAVAAQAMSDSGLQVQDVQYVELIGGASRMANVKELVQTFFKQPPSFTLNADDAVARGCVLQGCIISPNFRVKDFQIVDCYAHSVSMKYQYGAELRDTEVFPRLHQFPHSKMITFHRREPLRIDAYYTNGQPHIPADHQQLSSYNVANIPPLYNEQVEESKIKMKCKLTNNGMFAVSSVTLIEKYPAPASDDKDKDKDKPAAPNGDKPAAMETSEATPSEPVANATDTNASANAATAASMETASNGPAARKMKSHQTELTIEIATRSGIAQEVVKKCAQLERDMIQYEIDEMARAEAKNAVEEYVYSMRGKLDPYDGELTSFVSEPEREQFMAQLNDAENWLYGDGEQERREVYVTKLDDLKKTGEPIANRWREKRDRPAFMNKLNNQLQRYLMALDLIARGDEKYNHLTADDVEKVRAACQRAQDIQGNLQNTFDNLPNDHNSPYRCGDIDEQRRQLEAACNPVLNKPKPAPPPPPAATPADDAAQSAKPPPDAGCNGQPSMDVD